MVFYTAKAIPVRVPAERRLSTAERIQFLDVAKGVIMLLLAAESCQVFSSIYTYPASGFVFAVIQQFYHHPWHGLHFWDLVQPSFMTVAGTVLYISYARKAAQGVRWRENFSHIAIRCLRLFFLGIFVLSVQSGKVVWELYNVLTQLAFTTMVSYLIIRKSVRFQLFFSLLLLVITEMCYRFVLVPGYQHPFVMQENFGSWIDMLIVGKKNIYGWVTINCVPTTAHTIWGVCVGKVLMRNSSRYQKLRTFMVAGFIGLAAGYFLDWSNTSPIIKRICTSSFIFVSGGWVLLILSFTYWLIDIRGKDKYAWIFTLVGMNAILIYLFFETVGYQWLNGVVGIFTGGLLGKLGAAPNISQIMVAFATLAVEWYLCYWLYQKKIFFKL